MPETLTCSDCGSDKLKMARHDFGACGWMEACHCTNCGRQMLDDGTPPLRAPISYECPRLEHTDPGLSEFFRLLAVREHPTLRGINLTARVSSFRRRDGSYYHRNKPLVVRVSVGRNDPCPCGCKKADGITPVKYKNHCGKT